MTDENSLPTRTRAAQNAVSDSAFVVGAFLACVGITLSVLETNFQPLWFFGGAILFLAMGSLTRSATVIRHSRQEPSWAPGMRDLQASVEAWPAKTHQALSDQGLAQQRALATMQEQQTALSERFDGMENWVAKHAVPLVQNPEPIIGPIVRRLTSRSTQDLDAMREDLKSLKRQCESAVRAFAALPPSQDLAAWPGTMQSLESGLIMLRERLDATAGEQPVLAEQLAAVRASVTSLQETQSAGAERWRLIQEQCHELDERMKAIQAPSAHDIGRRLEAMKTSILNTLPDVDAQMQRLRQQMVDDMDARRTHVPQDLAATVAALQVDLAQIPRRIDAAVAEAHTRWTRDTTHPAAHPAAHPAPHPSAHPAPHPSAHHPTNVADHGVAQAAHHPTHAPRHAMERHAAGEPEGAEAHDPEASRPTWKEASRPAIVPGGQPKRHAHNPHAVRDPSDQAAAADAPQETKASGPKSHKTGRPKGRSKRVAHARKLVSRPRRR